MIEPSSELKVSEGREAPAKCISSRLSDLTVSAAIILALWAAGFANSDQASARPNIVLISTDDQRADEIFGMRTVMEQLVQQGTTFSHAYAPFPLCCPARASIMSGQYAHNHNVLSNTAPLGGYTKFNSTSTLATWLRAAGYQTAFVGKYINEYGKVKPVTVPPGWMEWHAEVSGGDYFYTRLVESTGGAVTFNLYDGPYKEDVTGDIATRVIQRRIGSDQPMFLWVSFFAPHLGRPAEPDDPDIGTPAIAPRHRNAYLGTPLRQREYDPSFNEIDVSDKPNWIRSRPSLTTAMRGKLTELYQQRLESLLAVDENIRKIIDALRASGELDNTIIVYLSDNGYVLGEHRLHAGKNYPYEPSIRIPFIVRGPGFPAGVTRTQPVALIDLAPTFLQVAGGTAGLPQDGMSLLPLAADPSFAANRWILFEAMPYGDSTGERWFFQGVRSQRWLYLEYEQTGEVEMYDMAKDPYQLRSVSADPTYSTQRTWLANVLNRLRNCSGAGCRN